MKIDDYRHKVRELIERETAGRCKLLNERDGPKDTQIASDETWAIPGGTMIVRYYKDGNGCAHYPEGGRGWEDMASDIQAMERRNG